MHEVELIKQHLSITAALERFTMADLSKLKGSKGHIPCPFHSDKHSSFYVDTIKDAWHCFGACATGGDVINLYARAHGVGNKEAIAQLCGLLGIKGDTPTREQREQLRREQEARELIGKANDNVEITIVELSAIYRKMQEYIKAAATLQGQEVYKISAIYHAEPEIAYLLDCLCGFEVDTDVAGTYFKAKEAVSKWKNLI